MTLKECRKIGREEIANNHRLCGYIYFDKNKEYYFSFTLYTSILPVYELGKDGTLIEYTKKNK